MKENIIIDTDVLIYLNKKKMLDKFVELFDGYITCITLYEYLRGEQRIGRDIKKVKEFLENLFVILPFDNEAIHIASKIWSKLSKQGRIISDRDIINAAIAIVNELPFVTGNLTHYERLKDFGLDLYSLKDLLTILSNS